MVLQMLRTLICLDRRLLRGSLRLRSGHEQFYTGQPKRSISTYQFDFDPHAYTSGRFLRDDKRAIEARYIKFDFDALCRRAIQVSPGANSITACEKSEGGNNKAFIFTMDNNKQVAAKLPFAYAGPRRLVTASEVATIRYLQNKTSIPIPDIIDWSDDASNTIGSEYTIMEHPDGVQLHQIWPDMSNDQRVRCIGALYEKLGEMTKLEFPAYGNIYYAGSAADHPSIQLPDTAFCIGPHCGTRYWDCIEPRHYQRVKPNRGPWYNFEAYCDGLVDAGYSRVPLEDDLKKRSRYHGTIEEHIKLLGHARPVVRKMAADRRVQDTATPTLFHPFLNKGSIFVSNDDPSIITGIIDWQYAIVEPGFWYSNEVPDFATIYTESDEGKDEHNREVLCAESSDACTKFYLSKIGLARSMEENTFRPFRYCYRTWIGGAVFFRHDLIELSKDWEYLGFSGSCPYPIPTSDQQAKHKEIYEEFKEFQGVMKLIEKSLHTGPDCWVPPEHYETIMAIQKEWYDYFLSIALKPENHDPGEPLTTEEDVRAIWPYDV